MDTVSWPNYKSSPLEESILWEEIILRVIDFPLISSEKIHIIFFFFWVEIHITIQFFFSKKKHSKYCKSRLKNQIKTNLKQKLHLQLKAKICWVKNLEKLVIRGEAKTNLFIEGMVWATEKPILKMNGLFGLNGGERGLWRAV